MNDRAKKQQPNPTRRRILKASAMAAATA